MLDKGMKRLNSKIRIGKYWGSKIDYISFLFNYVIFIIKEDIRFFKPKGCSEVITNRMYEYYEEFLPKEAGLMLDIGPQYSDWSVIAAKKYGTQIISFEASKMNFDVGKRNIYLNKMQDKIEPHNYAIGNKNEDILVRYASNMVNSNNNGIEVKTRMMTLDSFNFENRIPDLIKIDIEGFELEALMGMKKLLSLYHPRIILETHSVDLKEKCSSLLEDLGYKNKYNNKGRRLNETFDWVQESFWNTS